MPSLIKPVTGMSGRVQERRGVCSTETLVDTGGGITGITFYDEEHFFLGHVVSNTHRIAGTFSIFAASSLSIFLPRTTTTTSFQRVRACVSQYRPKRKPTRPFFFDTRFFAAPLKLCERPLTAIQSRGYESQRSHRRARPSDSLLGIRMEARGGWAMRERLRHAVFSPFFRQKRSCFFVYGAPPKK